jgi:hypothetical protein
MGDPGVGKSRLFFEFKAVAQSGCLVMPVVVAHGGGRRDRIQSLSCARVSAFYQFLMPSAARHLHLLLFGLRQLLE